MLPSTLKATDARATVFLTDCYVWNYLTVSTAMDFLKALILPRLDTWLDRFSEMLCLIFYRSASSFLSGELPYSPSGFSLLSFFARDDLSVSKDLSWIGLLLSSF